MAALLTSVQRNNVLLDGPSLLLQAVIIPGDRTTEGQLVEAVALPWFEIIELISRSPESIHEIDWRKWEEIIAAAYKQQGFDVTLTPRIARGICEGAPSKGETDTLECAHRFVAFLWSQGKTWWAEPVMEDVRDRPWVDCKALDQRDRRKREFLQMQVQRAMVCDERYTKWRDHGHHELPSGTTSQQAAEILMEAIENKRRKAASDVVLLLDAARLPWLAFDMVVSEFKRLYRPEARTVGFRDVYVVPWHASLVARLDTSEQE
jgi:hypothetical protein